MRQLLRQLMEMLINPVKCLKIMRALHRLDTMPNNPYAQATQRKMTAVVELFNHIIETE